MRRSNWNTVMALQAMASYSMSGIRGALRQRPMLRRAARRVRSLISASPKSFQPLPGYAPLRVDGAKLKHLAQISPAIVDTLLAEFAELSRVLRGSDSGFNDGARAALDDVLNGLLLSALEVNLVYTPGHVGSCTAASTLERHPSIKSAIPVGHHLSKKNLAWLQRRGEQCARWPKAVGSWRESVFWSWLLRIRVLLSHALCVNGGVPDAPFRKPFVITGVREPIAGDLSCCFYSWWAFADTPAAVTLNAVHENLQSDPWHLRCNDWFDDELKEMFGVDVFARPFPVDRGWDIHENHVARVLIIRQENLARLPDALGALYGIDPLELPTITSNTAKSKDYAPYHDAVKRALRLPEKKLEQIYRIRYVRHFYSPDEIAGFQRRWQR